MSGGRFNYQQERLAYEMFDWLSVSYGEQGFSQASKARRLNPLKDKQLSELCWDLLCVIHSYDWYASGDTGEEDYKEDVKYFKEKWLKTSGRKLALAEVNKSIEELRLELYETLLFKKTEDESE